MMEETYLMEHVKEQACYVSSDLKADLQRARMPRSPNRREYVLPDGVNSTTGFLRTPLDSEPGPARQQQASNEQARQKSLRLRRLQGTASRYCCLLSK